MDNLEKSHKVFQDEVKTAAWSFFVWKSFHNIASADRDTYRAINENAVSWNIITHSLQSTFFLVLGRLFDVNGDAFSVHSLLRSCIEHIDQFSLDNLRQRKVQQNGGAEPDWLDQYIKDAYQPVEEDFKRLRGEVSKQQKIYEERYRPIRHQVIAHRQIDTIENVSELFGNTNIGQIQDFINFLHQIENIVFDLLYNGKLNPIGHYNFSENERAHEDVGKLLEKLKT